MDEIEIDDIPSYEDDPVQHNLIMKAKLLRQAFADSGVDRKDWEDADKLIDEMQAHLRILRGQLRGAALLDKKDFLIREEEVKTLWRAMYVSDKS